MHIDKRFRDTTFCFVNLFLLTVHWIFATKRTNALTSGTHKQRLSRAHILGARPTHLGQEAAHKRVSGRIGVNNLLDRQHVDRKFSCLTLFADNGCVPALFNADKAKINQHTAHE